MEYDKQDYLNRENFKQRVLTISIQPKEGEPEEILEVEEEKKTVVYSDGSFYEGEFKLGKKHGKGKINEANGFIYDGDWVNDVKEGKAVC